MTAKEKEVITELVKYAKAVGLNGHTGVREILKDLIDKTEKLLKK